MNSEIKKILEASIQAPSGENSQPWKFKVKNNIVDLFNVPEQDLSLYNWGQRGSYLANGAVLENISIAASAQSYKAEIELFPTKGDENYIARIIFLKQELIKNELNDYIYLRATNRKKYNPIEINKNQIQKLIQSSIEDSYGTILFTQNKDDIKKLAEVASANEEIMLSNLYLHNFFFTHINWTKEEDTKKKVGFYIETLELPLPAKILFKLFKNWKIMNLFNKINFNKFISKQNALTYASASAMGIIVADANTAIDYVKVGKIMQRMWLRATEMGLSMHPLTGTLYFMSNLENGESDKFSKKQIDLIKKSHNQVKNIFNIKNNHIAFMFRLGDGGIPSARSSRFDIEQVVEVIN